MMVQARNNRIKDYDDFRKEIVVENREGGKLIFDTYTSEKPRVKGVREWTKLGHIELTESIASVSTDHHLHFHHLKLRNSGIKNIPRGI